MPFTSTAILFFIALFIVARECEMHYWDFKIGVPLVIGGLLMDIMGYIMG